MVETCRCGSIIHMSSKMGHVGGARRTLYCASKWAVEGLSKAMALDLAPHKIRVTTIAPTFIETAMTAPFFPEETIKRKVPTNNKLARLGQVEAMTRAQLSLNTATNSSV